MNGRFWGSLQGWMMEKYRSLMDLLLDTEARGTADVSALLLRSAMIPLDYACECFRMHRM